MEEPPQTWAQMWALCRRDHGLTWTEFEDLSLAEFEAFEDRRAIEIRHARHDAAFVVASMFNLQGAKGVTAYDFLPGFQREPEEVEAEQQRRDVVREIRRTFVRHSNATADQVRIIRGQIVSDLKRRGFEDAEVLIAEAYPSLAEG